MNAVLHKSVLSNTQAPSPMWLFKLTKINPNVNFCCSVTLATFQVLGSHRGLVATAPDRADTGHFHQDAESSLGEQL